MKFPAFLLLVSSLLLLPVQAQQGRITTQANVGSGSVTIEYGAPTWRPELLEAINAGLEAQGEFAWRLGSNDPTILKTNVGLVADAGVIPPGDYRAAVQISKGGPWRLAVYEGSGHYAVGRKAWFITSALEIHDRAGSAEKLAIDISKKGLLTVAFGPKVISYVLETVPVLPAVETDFANVSTHIECLALECKGPMERTRVGTATARMGGDFAARWEMYLTMKPEGAVLEFQNTQADTLAADRASTQDLVERVGKMIADAGDRLPANRREGMEAFIANKKVELEQIDANLTALERINKSMTIPGTIAKGTGLASTLQFTHERPVGSIVLNFAAGEHAASFPINPREFRAARRR